MLACAGESCALAIGSLTDAASASAAFTAVFALTVSAGAGGSVAVAVDGVDGVAAATAVAGESTSVAVTALSAVTLTAVPATGQRLDLWTLSGGNGMLACAAQSCALAAGSLTANASASAAFEAAPNSLEAVAGANGSVSVAVDGAVAGTAAAGESTSVAVAAGSAVVLTADPDDGWRLSAWMLSGGNGSLECVEGPLSSNPCTLAIGSLTADASATATFEAVFALTVSAGEGGSVAVAVDGAAAAAAAAEESTSVVVTALSAVVLTAVATAGHSFDSWALSGGNGMLACAAATDPDPNPNACALATGSFTAAASASAAFESVPRRLEVAANAGGSVNVMIDGVSAGRASAGTTEGFDVDVGSAAALTADPDPGWRLLSWTLSGGNGMLACADRSCALATGSFTADASATATFEAIPRRLDVAAGAGGEVTVTGAGADARVGAATTDGFDVDVLSAVALEAIPATGHRFAGWTLSGGNGMLACDGESCTLAAGSLTADSSASAAFEAIPHRLEAGAGAGGRVNVMIGGVSAGGASAGTTGSFSVAAGSAVVLTAVHAAGWAFSAWTLSGGNGSLECAEGPLSSNPCTLAADSFTADSSASAAFEATPYRLEAGAGAGGRVNVMIDGVSAGGASAGTTGSFSVDVRSTVELEAVPDAGQGLAGWTLSGGNGSLECAPDPNPNSCTLAARSFTDDASASAAFAADLSLAVSAGAGGRVTVAVGGGAPVTVDAGESTDVAVAVGSAVALTAIPADSNVFAGWTGACAGAGARCELPAGAGASAAATFGSAAMTLAVSAGAGGGVDVAIGQAATRTVGAGRESTYVVAAASAAALTARPGFGRLFDRWTPLGELDLPCADPAAAVCELAAGSASGGAAAAFGTRQSALTVSAGDDGSVTVTVDGADARTVTAGSSTDVAVTVDDAVALAASPVAGALLLRWALSDGLACRDGPDASPCMLYPIGADGSADAEFSPLPSAVSWTGPGAVEEDGLALTAVPYADGAFEEWQGAPCDGSAEPECMRPDSGSGYPVAVFRPFAAAGIKSLAFGLGYQGESPHSFQVSLNRGRGGGYELPPALEGLPGSGQASASLTVPVHLLPWGRGGYLTEACDASNMCEAALGGERLLAQAVSRAVTGYFKAPVANSGDYGSSLALSRDGTTLAVGAPDNDSSYAGVFALEDPDYQAALASGGENNSGATYVYRLLSTGRWAIEAFVKAPVADVADHFGWALALSADGATLAVGSLDGSSHTGVFVLEGPGYQAALANNDADESGAVTVYRRSDAGRWTIEAFVKAPRPVDDSYFGVNRSGGAQGATVALSADGATLAVGEPFNESGSTGTFVPSDEPGSDYRHALNNNDAPGSGAAYVYRRSDGDRWTIEAFIKAPFVETTDVFGSGVALSADGSVLAVGAPGEDSSHAGVFVPGGAGYQAALSSNNASGNGAVTVYRRSAAGQWGIEAFVKPLVSSNDEFARFFALSGDGATLAVGAYNEDSGSIGAFAPGDAGYQAALSSGGASNSGAVTVYRRSAAGRWAIEAFVKAPHRVLNSKFGAQFGISVDLSSNGVVMAVGSTGENSSFSGVFVPGVEGYQGALDDDSVDSSSAAYVYRRSDTGRWAIEAFVKAPNPDADDNFGTVLALSGDGSALAVQAPFEDGAALPQPVGGRSADTENAVEDSGAVYLY